jgi:glyoxylase-like metal-dependent hydrolase (beta-lactamase superfamily II)
VEEKSLTVSTWLFGYRIRGRFECINPNTLRQEWLVDTPKKDKSGGMPAIAVKQFVSSSGVRLYRIPCQVFETLTARVYLLLGAGPPTLVDAGSRLDASTRQILAGLEAVRAEFGEAVGPSDIGRILLTHGHADHVGGLEELLRHTSAEVAIHPLDSKAVTAPREHAVLGRRRLIDFLDRAGVTGLRRDELLSSSPYAQQPSLQLPVRPRLLQDGEELDGLRIVHTPGHSPGHVCIVAGDVLLSGDHLLSHTLPHQWPESATPYTGLGHYLESLRKIGRLGGLRLALAAHEQVIHDVYRRIETVRATHRRRLERLLETIRGAVGPLSVHEIASQLYPELSGFRARLSITDVGSRVEYLHQRGQLAVANLDELEREPKAVYRYRAV